MGDFFVCYTSLMQTRLFYCVLLGFTVGVGLATVFQFAPAVILWVMVLAFGVGLVWRRRSEAPAARVVLLCSVTLLALSLGMLRIEVAAEKFGHSALEAKVGQTVELTGVVAKEPTHSTKTVQFYLETDTDLVLISADRMTKVSYGDVVQVAGKLERPDSFTTELGRTFDYPGYLKARGVKYRISFAEVAVTGKGEANRLVAGLLMAKGTFINSLETYLPEPAVGLGEGLLLGVKAALGDDIETNFRRTGIIHIVVLSGYNVMLVVAFILFCFSYFLPQRLRLLCAVLAIAAFALIVGLSATVLRASVMASLVLLAQFLGRNYQVLRALLFAGVVMLLINPYLLVYDVGFQLSFMATLGLVLILPHFEKVVATGGVVGVKEFLLSTLATQIAVLPLLMYHIGEVSLIALLVNLLVLPVVPLAMLLTFLAGVAGLLFAPLALFCGYLATLSLQYILWIAAVFAALPFATVSVPAFSALGMLGLYGVMFVVWCWLEQRALPPADVTMSDWIIEDEMVAKEHTPVFFQR
jgi:competence protein ComEC